MTGIIAVVIVIAAIFFIFFSELRQKNQMEEELKAVIGSEQLLYGTMANLAEGSRSVRGFFALTKQALYFIEAPKKSGHRATQKQDTAPADADKADINKKACVRLRLEYSEILSHKLYFSVFIEDSEHKVHEIKAPNNAAAYRALTKQCDIPQEL